MEKAALIELINRYKVDPESVYSTWFINGVERMKAFRAIRRGVKDTVDAIAAGNFRQRLQRLTVGISAHGHHRTKAGL